MTACHPFHSTNVDLLLTTLSVDQIRILESIDVVLLWIDHTMGIYKRIPKTILVNEEKKSRRLFKSLILGLECLSYRVGWFFLLRFVVHVRVQLDKIFKAQLYDSILYILCSNKRYLRTTSMWTLNLFHLLKMSSLGSTVRAIIMGKFDRNSQIRETWLHICTHWLLTKTI